MLFRSSLADLARARGLYFSLAGFHGYLELSVVAPAHNEQENVEDLVRQVEAALAPLGLPWEFVVVDDVRNPDAPPRVDATCVTPAGTPSVTRV